MSTPPISDGASGQVGPEPVAAPEPVAGPAHVAGPETAPMFEPGAAYPYAQAPFAQAKPPKSRRIRGLLKVAGLVVAIVVALFVAAWFARDTPSAAKAGDCAHNAGSEAKPDVSLVDCGASNAEFVVLKVIHGADEKECETEPELVATYVEKRRSSTLVLCLGVHRRTPGS